MNAQTLTERDFAAELDEVNGIPDHAKHEALLHRDAVLRAMRDPEVPSDQIPKILLFALAKMYLHGIKNPGAELAKTKETPHA